MAPSKLRAMDLASLRCFQTVAKHLNLTRAGLELGVSEAAISQRLRKFERYLGTKLYEAPGGHVRLTKAGERTRELAARLLEQVEQFERTVASEEERENITVLANDVALRYLLVDVVANFRAAHPLVRLQLFVRRREEALVDLAGGRVDLLVAADEVNDGDFSFFEIDTYSPHLIMARGHPLARRARRDFASIVAPATLDRYPLVLTEEQLESGKVQERLRSVGLEVRHDMVVGTLDTLKAYVATGTVIALVSGLCIEPIDRERLEVVDVPPELGGATRYGVLVKRQRHLSRPILTLFELLRVTLGES